MTIEVPPASASGRELLDALPVAAVLLVADGGDLRVEYANPAARREAGIPLEGAAVGERLPVLRDAARQRRRQQEAPSSAAHSQIPPGTSRL